MTHCDTDPAVNPEPRIPANSPGLTAGGFSDKLRVLDLFSGIGGFSLGLERTGGFETVAFCEIEPFPRRVLAKHWPEVPCYDDVRTLTGDVLRRDGIAVDVITGGFPCQDLSVAGKQRGMGEGTRSGLWSEIVRLVGELRPQYIIVENVAALLAGPSERRGASGLWPTPCKSDQGRTSYNANNRIAQGHQEDLSTAVHVRMFPTPTATMHKGSSPAALTRKDGQDRSRDRLDHFLQSLEGSGQLNPTWVEWLMGWRS